MPFEYHCYRRLRSRWESAARRLENCGRIGQRSSEVWRVNVGRSGGYICVSHRHSYRWYYGEVGQSYTRVNPVDDHAVIPNLRCEYDQ